MSLKDQFDTIKQGVETKRTGEQLKEGKKVFGEIGTEKQALTDKINGLKELLNQLETGYSSSRADLNEFKDSKAQIEGLYTEYAEYLKEKGIDSVSDILHNESFSGDEEVKKYHQTGAAKLNKEDSRGKLGESVGTLETVKAKAKAALPDMALDFRGKKKDGAEISPRQESILNIKKYIQALEKEQLAPVQEKEAAAKAEYLPKIKEIISHNIDNLPPEDSNYSFADRVAGSQLITDEVFKICGDELWPEAKKIAADLLSKKLNELGGRGWNKEIEGHLEAEKLVFDVEDLRSKHETLLDLDKDRGRVLSFGKNLQSDLFRRDSDTITVENGLAFSGELLKQAQYFKEKNPAAKKDCEEVKQNLLVFFKKTLDELKAPLLAGKESREDMDKVKGILQESISQIEKKDVPEYFYSDDLYNFSNAMSNAIPHFGAHYRHNWFQPLVDKLSGEPVNQMKRISGLQDSERQSMSKFTEDRYQFNRSRSCGATNENGLKLPYMPLGGKELLQSFNDKKEIISFLASLEGTTLTQEQFAEMFKKEVAVFEAEIKNYPNSEEILNRFKQLQEKFNKEFEFQPKFVDSKLGLRRNRRYSATTIPGKYAVRQELFG